ncbi:MAG: molybdate ABC transporter substrate-binding protein [Vulcanimicrobiaceae bacterium]
MPLRVLSGDTLTVYAAASLREAFEAAAPDFTKQTGTTVTFAFGGSDTLATQILAGAPAGVFASANEKQMQRLVAAAALAGAPQTFARNSLVLAVPAGTGVVRRVRTLADLARPGVRVLLAAPTVPVGGYARAAIAKMAGRAGYARDFAAAVERNVVSNELDVKAVATKIALGEADAGIVYATDVTPALAATLGAIALPPEAATDAAYPIAVVRGDGAGTGRAFVDFVLHDGQRFLRARGFRSP